MSSRLCVCVCLCGCVGVCECLITWTMLKKEREDGKERAGYVMSRFINYIHRVFLSENLSGTETFLSIKAFFIGYPSVTKSQPGKHSTYRLPSLFSTLVTPLVRAKLTSKEYNEVCYQH